MFFFPGCILFLFLFMCKYVYLELELDVLVIRVLVTEPGPLQEEPVLLAVEPAFQLP